MLLNEELIMILEKLISNWENEVVEFKEANDDYTRDKIGRYFSAISNEANLRNVQFGWLVFGVRNKDRKIIGTNYRNTEGLNKLKQEVTVNTTGGLSFLDIYEVYIEVDGEEKRVVMMQIPAAVAGIPTGWNDHYYGRNGESLSALSIDEIERIRSQQNKDWSKQLIPNSNISHLNNEAIKLARKNYKEKMAKSHIVEEIDNMSDEDFLTKIKLIQDGKLTNAALLLLGNEDYDYLFENAPEASWRLYDYKNDVKDYEIFKIPFITLGDRLVSKIRNLTYRYMTNENTLFPNETKQYDPWMLRELINNCIAHSNYICGNRIYVDEEEDQITFKNPGSFLPGSIEVALEKNYNSPFYRNQLLAETMVKFNMIDTQSMGIRRVFRIQKEKFFPMPDYDLSKYNQVGVTVIGKVLNDSYTKVLFEHPEFDIETVYLIDQVQKRKRIDSSAVKYLRKLGVIEGKQPNIYLSAGIAETLDEKSNYVKNKAFDNEFYEKLIQQYLEVYGNATREDLKKLLDDKLSNALTPERKDRKIKNLLQNMKRRGVIEVKENHARYTLWGLKK